MKFVGLMIFSLLMLFQTAVAQEKQAVKEPEYIGVFLSMDENGSLTALERQTPETKIKIKGLGFGGGESLLRFKGEQSTVRFKSDQKITFVVRVASQAIDPMSLIEFYRFDSKKGYRQLTIAKVGSIGTNSKTTISEYTVQFNAAKYGESSFKVVPANALPSGEYCLSTSGTKDGFCFGIDAKTPGE